MKARLFVVGTLTALLAALSAGPLVAPATSGGVAPAAVMPVSYTHLTLPTICSV